jgi:hypothetical protein
MKTIYYTLILLISILLYTSCSEEKIEFIQTGTLTGRVVEASNFSPIENAKVTISPTNNSVFTDTEGYYFIEEVPVGDYSVTAQKEGFLAGYEPMNIFADATVNLVFELEISDALNKVPFAPNLLSPEDNATDLPLEIELTWSVAEDPDDDPLTYGVILRNDQNDEVQYFTELTDTIFTLNNLEYGIKYFWQVSVNDGFHEDVLTEISTFETTHYPNNRYFYVRKVGGNNIIFSNSEENETEIAVTSATQNCWRPRKNPAIELVAFLKTEGSETHLFTMKPDGSDIQQVSSDVPLVGFKQSELDFAWATDGSQLIYPSFDKLYIINKDGSGNQLLYQTTDGSYITECDWSYDGSIIALKTNDIDGYNASVFTIDMSGNILTQIVQYGIGGYGGINLSIDNHYLIYTHDLDEFESSNYRQLNSHVLLYDLITNEQTDLSADKESGTNDLDPRFAPDEAHIIFVNTSNDGISTPYTYIMNLDGNERTETFLDASMPDWE